MPDMGQKQLRQMTRMLTQFKPGRPTQDLLQAVELCKGSLYRLRPEVYTITRLDVHYPRGETESRYMDGFVADIRRLVSLRPHWLAVGGAIGVPVAGYLALQIAGATRVAFWALVLVVLLMQAPAVLSYNRLDWLAFGEMPSLPTGLFQAAVGGLFLLSLVLLVTLHRTDDLRRLSRKLSTMNLSAGGQRQVVAGELTAVAGLVAGSLGVMAILGLVGVGLGRMDQLLLRSPWTVLSVGGTAVFLMAVFLSLWLRTRRSS